MDRIKWKLLKTSYNTHRDRDNERVQCVFPFTIPQLMISQHITHQCPHTTNMN